MQKINLRELYPDVYKTDVFVDVAEEVLEQKQLRKEVYTALMQLPSIQARRIYARFYLGMAVKEIAQIEGVDRRRVWASIRRGLKKLAYLLDANK